jgi:hypothetical protein
VDYEFFTIDYNPVIVQSFWRVRKYRYLDRRFSPTGRLHAQAENDNRAADKICVDRFINRIIVVMH